MCDLFCNFLLALRFSARKSEIKKTLISTGTSGQIYKNFVCPKEYFQKKNSKYEIFESFIFWSKFPFLGDGFRAFFVVGQPWWSTCLLSPAPPSPPPLTATIKKPPTALLGYIYNDFAVNLFLKYSSCTCQEKLPGHAEEPNVAKQLVWRIFTSWFILYICCFLHSILVLRKFLFLLK